MLIFVYGTLRGGHPFLGDAESLGMGRVEGFTLINLGSFPGMIPLEGGHVIGEIFNVDADQMPTLDRYEGYGYERERIAVTVENRKAPLYCQAYIFRHRPSGFSVETFSDWYAHVN